MEINGVGENPYAFLNSQSEVEEESKGNGDLALEDFLSLMTKQLQNQDPLKPLESGEFLGQIASFATVTGIEDLNKSFDTFASSIQSSQALQGSALVGRSVLVPSSIGNLSADEGLKGQINVADPVTDLKVDIFNEAGVRVRTLEMGSASGFTSFTWDGFNDDGEIMEPGVYQFTASGTVDDVNTAFATATEARVDSVLVGAANQGLVVNLAGIGAVPFSEVIEIT